MCLSARRRVFCPSAYTRAKDYIGNITIRREDVDGGSNKNDGGGLTGTVIDIGDGVTHVIPVCDGYVVSSESSPSC